MGQGGEGREVGLCGMRVVHVVSVHVPSLSVTHDASMTLSVVRSRKLCVVLSTLSVGDNGVWISSNHHHYFLLRHCTL